MPLHATPPLLLLLHDALLPAKSRPPTTGSASRCRASTPSSASPASSPVTYSSSRPHAPSPSLPASSLVLVPEPYAPDAAPSPCAGPATKSRRWSSPSSRLRPDQVPPDPPSRDPDPPLPLIHGAMASAPFGRTMLPRACSAKIRWISASPAALPPRHVPGAACPASRQVPRSSPLHRALAGWHPSLATPARPT